MFDDPAVEIQELTAVIKQDIESLKSAIDDLQRITDASDTGNRNKHTNDHSTTVVDNLKTRLMSTTKSFKDVLTLRTEVTFLTICLVVTNTFEMGLEAACILNLNCLSYSKESLSPLQAPQHLPTFRRPHKLPPRKSIVTHYHHSPCHVSVYSR